MSLDSTCAVDSVASVAIPMVPKRRGLTNSEFKDLKESLSKQGYNYIGLSITPITEEVALPNLAKQKEEIFNLIKTAYALGLNSIEILEAIEYDGLKYSKVIVYAK